jgi:formate hydrogenlyase subunit 6/NADH:ubiquinone oxidoreductase subunit I
MGYFIDSFRAMGITLKNLMRPPTTVEFPKHKRERAERFRTSFALLHDEGGDELCIGCVACERICPSQVITVVQGGKRESPVTGKKRAYADDLTLDLNACIFCELCVQVCPVDALVMLRVHDEPQYSREGLFLSMPRLYENEQKAHSWGTGNKLMDMQDPKRGAPPPAKPAPKAEAAPKAAAAKPETAETKPEAAKPPAIEPEAATPASQAGEAKPDEAEKPGEGSGQE